MKLIRTKETATIEEGNAKYTLTDLYKWTDTLYYLPQPKYLVRIWYETNKNS